MRYNSRSILTLCFALLGVGSTIYVSFAAWNNLLLYPGLAQIQTNQSYQLESIHLARAANNASTLDFQVEVMNPSGYSGFRLFSVAVSVVFYSQTSAGNTSIFSSSDPIEASKMIGTPIAPNSALIVHVTTSLSSKQTSQMFSYASSPIFGVVNLRIDISTFLDSVTGTETYTRTQDVLLSYG